MTPFDGETGSGCFRLLSSAASDNAANAVSRPCALQTIHCMIARASTVYLKLYDETTVPTSSDTPVKTIAMQASQNFLLDLGSGFLFKNGIGIRMTTGVADADTGVLVAGDVLALNLDYA